MGRIYLDLETMTPEFMLALIRLFHGCGQFQACLDYAGLEPYVWWFWAYSSNGLPVDTLANRERWTERAEALQDGLFR